jgi:hypothetical protein
VRWLALAGYAIAEIGAITGHSPRDIDAILHAHYLGGQRELALQAMARWEGTTLQASGVPLSEESPAGPHLSTGAGHR